jgi:hypothetical protein
MEACAFGCSHSTFALNNGALLSTSDCRGNFVNIHSSEVKSVMAAVEKRQSAALAQQLFRNFNTLNIFTYEFRESLRCPI